MFNTFINVAYFVLMFASSMFYPIDGMPSWLRAVSFVNPVTWHTDVLRYATIGVGSLPTVIAESVAFLVFVAVSFGMAVRVLTRGVVK